MYYDVKLTNEKGYYDISITNDGNVATTEGLDSVITLALLTDIRADESEVQDSINRRGWWGNSVDTPKTSSVGSKLWLLSNDKPSDATLGLAKSYAREALQFLIDDEYVDDLDIDGELTLRSIKLTIKTVIGSDITSYNVSLWSKTNVSN